MRELAYPTDACFAIDERSETPKFLQIANRILSQIEDGVYQPGDRLPSINETSEEFLMARATVEKAYKKLFQGGHIKSTYRKGFFITEQQKVKRVLLVLGEITETSLAIYNNLSKQLDKTYKIDICLHQYKKEYLQERLEKQAGDFHYFVVVSSHLNEIQEMNNVFSKIPNERLIFLDAESSNRKSVSNYSTINYSSFSNFKNVLLKNAEAFKQYKELYFVTTDNDYIPAEWYTEFLLFAQLHNLDGRIIDSPDEVELKDGAAYLVFDNNHLVSLVKESKKKGLTIGENVGLVSFGDSIYKELIAGGISVIKTDTAAVSSSLKTIITSNQKQSVNIPMVLIKRNSL
ncbi:GntR family transcriptional regulator [uncultured Arcticibacterium sp.]|uniref:GntR family transcriptional regulator n=1 Tax=uncultured Arcticibacterium sp. TaxID=2173042 RepID=UPI0030FB2A1C